MDKDRRKATVVVSAWEEEFIKIPSRASCFVYRTILKNRMNSSFSFKSFRCNSSYILFKIVLGKIAYAARNWINSSPQTEAMTFAFSSVFILLLCTRTPRSPLQQDIPKYECPASDNDNTSFSLSLIQSEDEGTSPRCSPSLFSSLQWPSALSQCMVVVKQLSMSALQPARMPYRGMSCGYNI